MAKWSIRYSDLSRVLAAVLLCVAAATPARADDMHTVTLALDATDSLALADPAARQAVLVRAEAAGLSLIMRRLTASRDHARLPTAEGSNVAGYIERSAIVEDVADGIGLPPQVRVSVRGEAVHQLLTNLGITFVDMESPGLVVIPVYQANGGEAVLWSGHNPWLDAWSREGSGVGGLTPIIAPYGEFGDLDAVTQAEAIAGDTGALAALADRYQADGTLVAHYQSDGQRARVQLAVIADGAWRASTAVTVPVEDPISAGTIAAIRAAVDRLWVERQIQPAYEGAVATLEVTALFDDLADWIAIRRALDGARVIARFDVPLVGGRSARVILHHHADLATVQRDLSVAGIVLERAGVGSNMPTAMILRPTGVSMPTDQAPPWVAAAEAPPFGQFGPDGASPAPGRDGRAPAPGRDGRAPASATANELSIPALRFEP